jgi:hypothetical protein
MRRTPRSHRRVAILAGSALIGGSLVLPAYAQASALIDLGAQGWLQGTTTGFGITGPTTIAAAAGTYSAGSSATVGWCSPFAASAIQSAVVHIVRAQAASPVIVSAGPNPDGSGGLSEPDSAIPTGTVGTNLVLSPLGSPCVSARIAQSALGTSASRQWTLALSDVSLVDEQGPSVSNLLVAGPETNSWYTGPLKVFWQAADNQLLRGVTGVQVSTGPTVNLGDAADNTELSATIDPGSDGPHRVTVYRTAGGGWPTAESSATINVDRTPPSIPQMIAPPAGAYPVSLTTTPSTDGASGSGVARVEFTADGGHTVLSSNVLTRPGSYAVAARAIDVAGNASSWSSPISVVVPASASGAPGGSGSQGGTAVLHLARITIDGRTPGSDAAIALTRTSGAHIQVSASVADGLGAPARGAQITVADATGVLARGTTNAAGRIVIAVPVRRSGTIVLTANGGGALVRINLLMRPLLTLAAGERHAIGGAPLRLGAHRLLTITGTASPISVVAGQPVQLEYLLGRAWLPLGVPGAVGRNGHWRVRYAVARPGSAVVRMRVLLPSQPGLRFAAGTTPVFRVAIG